MFFFNCTQRNHTITYCNNNIISHIQKLRKLINLKNKKLRNFHYISFFSAGVFFIFWHCILKTLHRSQPIRTENFFMYIIKLVIWLKKYSYPNSYMQKILNYNAIPGCQRLRIKRTSNWNRINLPYFGSFVATQELYPHFLLCCLIQVSSLFAWPQTFLMIDQFRSTQRE